MKTFYRPLLASATLAISMGGGLVLSNSAYAAAVSLEQADFTFASCDDGTTISTHGVRCFDVGGANLYLIPDGEYELSEDITLDGGAAHQGDSFSLNLNSHNLTNSSIDAPTLTLNGKSSIISGTGAITNTESGISVVATGDPDPSTLVINGGTFGSVGASNTNTTINGGTFTGSGWMMAFAADGSNVVVNGGTFSAAAASAMYFNNGADNSLEVNGGTFTSAADFGIEFMDGIKDLKITAGTFSGGHAGLAFEIAPTTATLSGGTYIATANDEYTYGGIVIFGADDISALANLLAAGSSYSDPSAERKGTDPDFWVYLTNHNVTITSGAAAEEESSAKSPNSGFITAETSAATSVAATVIAATALTAAGLGLKKSLKKAD